MSESDRSHCNQTIDKFIYFGNLYPHEPQFQSGLFYGLALTPRFERDIAHDARKNMPFADGSVKGFQSQDVFEHIPYQKIPAIMDDIFRCLQKGGIFRLSLPDYNSPLLRRRSVYDADGNILCDLAMGGMVSATLNDGVQAGFAGEEGDSHIWFPTFNTVLPLILTSEIRKCDTIQIHHAWIDKDKWICKPFEQGVMPVSRVPPHDMRADGKPISIVIDFIK